jgi:hypothetical protein
LFSAFSELCEQLSKELSYTGKTRILREYFNSLSEAELILVLKFLLHCEEGAPTRLGPKQLLRHLLRIYQVDDEKRLKERLKLVGDLTALLTEVRYCLFFCSS